MHKPTAWSVSKEKLFLLKASGIISHTENKVISQGHPDSELCYQLDLLPHRSSGHQRIRLLPFPSHTDTKKDTLTFPFPTSFIHSGGMPQTEFLNT